jgi:NADP-dependent aldehyde dehydrogenase
MAITLTGSNFTGFAETKQGSKSFQAFSALQNQDLQGDFHYATGAELQNALQLAHQAFSTYQKLSFEKRARFLDAIAEEIMNLGEVLIERCVAETALPVARITGERGRTCGQLKMFAQLLRDGWWVDARIDTAQPQRQASSEIGYKATTSSYWSGSSIWSFQFSFSFFNCRR